jgi:hypothetical protein
VRRIVEAEIRHLIELSLEGAQCDRADLGEPTQSSNWFPRSLTDLAIWVFINISPLGWTVWPYQQAEPLEKSITAAAVCIRASDIFADT